VPSDAAKGGVAEDNTCILSDIAPLAPHIPEMLMMPILGAYLYISFSN
jgi:hypothetical protein